MKTVAKFMNAEEAHLLRIRLAGFGVPAVVCDDLTTTVAPFLTNAIGGVRVQVSDDDYETAQELVVRDMPDLCLKQTSWQSE